MVDAGTKARIGAGLEEQFDGRQIAFGHSHVQRGMVVDAALIRIGLEGKQEFQDVDAIRPSARQGRDQGRKARMTGGIGIAPISSSVRMKGNGLR